MENNNENAVFVAIKSWLESPKVALMNPARMEALVTAQRCVQKMLNDAGISGLASIAPSPLQTGDFTLSIEAESVLCRDAGLFSDIIAWAQNFEIYPMDNGNIRIDIMFPAIALVQPMEAN